jgi:hypothetical protein
MFNFVSKLYSKNKETKNRGLKSLQNDNVLDI